MLLVITNPISISINLYLTHLLLLFRRTGIVTFYLKESKEPIILNPAINVVELSGFLILNSTLETFMNTIVAPNSSSDLSLRALNLEISLRNMNVQLKGKIERIFFDFRDHVNFCMDLNFITRSFFEKTEIESCNLELRISSLSQLWSNFTLTSPLNLLGQGQSGNFSGTVCTLMPLDDLSPSLPWNIFYASSLLVRMEGFANATLLTSAGIVSLPYVINRYEQTSQEIAGMKKIVPHLFAPHVEGQVIMAFYNPTLIALSFSSKLNIQAILYFKGAALGTLFFAGGFTIGSSPAWTFVNASLALLPLNEQHWTETSQLTEWKVKQDEFVALFNVGSKELKLSDLNSPQTSKVAFNLTFLIQKFFNVSSQYPLESFSDPDITFSAFLCPGVKLNL